MEHARIEEMKAKAIETTPQVQVKSALPRLADRRYRRFWATLAFGPATFLGRGLAGSRHFVNSKVFQLCARFQLLPQPDGLCPSSCPRVARFVTVFDGDLSAFQRASPGP